MKGLTLMLAALLITLLSGCGKNPALSLTSDEFANRVNTFDRKGLKFFNGANSCGLDYAEKSYPKVLEELIRPGCEEYLKALAEELQKDKALKNLSVNDLHQVDTWKHYAASRFAKGKGFK